MAKRIKLNPGGTVSLKLLPDERELLLGDILIVAPHIEDKIRDIPAGQTEVALTLEDLEELVGCVAAEANHARDRRRAKKLHRIADRIERLLETFEEG